MKKSIYIAMAFAGILVILFSFSRTSSGGLKGTVQYEIHKKWELPQELNEISGIAWLGNNRIACVQDEDGKIFIYNLDSSKLENTPVVFSKKGDYEGIAVLGDQAFVMRSDGVLFEVSGFTGADPQVKSYVTQTNKIPGINIEGFCADPTKDRLLLAVKEQKGSSVHKEVYAFDLADKRSQSDPLFRVDLKNAIFKELKEKPEKRFSPGEIGKHPVTGEFYILDGTRPKILIAGADGTPKELIMLDVKDFKNPEGLTFSPEGNLFISNEAEGGSANILQISLKRTTK